MKQASATFKLFFCCVVFPWLKVLIASRSNDLANWKHRTDPPWHCGPGRQGLSLKFAWTPLPSLLSFFRLPNLPQRRSKWLKSLLKVFKIAVWVMFLFLKCVWFDLFFISKNVRVAAKRMPRSTYGQCLVTIDT